MKITNEQVAKCMGAFDFDKVAVLFRQNDWEYNEGIPDKQRLIDVAYERLKRVQEGFGPGSSYSSESGRFKATAYTEEEGRTVLKLELIAESVSV